MKRQRKTRAEERPPGEIFKKLKVYKSSMKSVQGFIGVYYPQIRKI
jgi:hypothetical protein